MLPYRSRLVVAAVLALSAGCTPSIGDKCSVSTDCSQLGDRLCDTTQPNGYCTIFNCEPDTWPDSVCVAFYDSICASKDPGQWPRFERTFCMKPCDDDGACRGDTAPNGSRYYACVSPPDRNAKIVDLNPIKDKVCMVAVPSSSSASSGGGTAGVCEPSDAGPPWTPFDGGAVTSSTASSGGMGGMGGAGGKGGMGGKGGAGGAGGAGGKGGAGGS